MENLGPIKTRPIILLVLGGALIGGALFVSFNFANSYDQQNTHPALTGEAVNFYNLNFPNNPLTENDKKWLIKGAIDEDTAPRPVNHFYDPIYNQGWVGYTSSKVWAYSSEKQVAFFGGKSQTAGFAQFFINNELSADDFSYQRALYDYAIGDRKRAMLAMGHIMHLLEDANVPDHTRNDTHLPWVGTESPYEKEMAKWSPSNLDIASKIFANGAKPILLSGLGDYFDKIAKYSNNYFFSEDTILSERYILPRKISEKAIEEKGEKYRFAMGRDRNGKLFPLFRMDPMSHWRNFSTPTEFTVDSPTVLDSYWSRLSKDFVPLGAGALKLFLDQAELVKREYAKNQQVVQKPGAFGGILGLLGVSGQGGQQLMFNPALIDSILEGSVVAANDVNTPPKPFPTPSATPLTSLTPFPTPSATPLPSATPTPSPSSSPAQLGGSSNSNNSGDNSQNSSFSSSPSPSPSPSATPSPAPSSSPSSTPSPSATPTPTPSPTSSPEPVPPGTKVVINEIAWMGTATSSNDEWLELRNISSESVDISGWVLAAADGIPNIHLASKSIEPFGFFLLERTDDTTISDISADQIYTGALGNSGEVLELRNKDGDLQDLVSKSTDGWYAGKNKKADDSSWQRFSMERIDPAKAGSDPTNWASNNGVIRNGHDAGGNPINGTPGAQNSVYMAENTTPAPTPTPTPTPTPGNIIWQYRVASASYINQPVAAKDGTIYFGAPNNATGVPRLYAIGSDGVEKWHHNDKIAGFGETAGLGIPTTPAISDDGAVYFGHLSSWVTALNPDGTLRWQYDTTRVNGVSVDDDGNVYATSDNKMINKIGPDGSKRWQVLNLFTFGFTPIPAPGGDTFLSANNSGQPEYYRLSGSDGSVIWQKRASDSFAYSTFDPVYDKTSGKLYASATDYGFIFTLDPSTGAMTKDTFQRMARPTTKTAVSGSFLVVGVDLTGINPASGSAVYALNKSDKSVAWTFPVDSPVNKEIAVDAGGNLYFTTFNYATKSSKLYSLDKDGQERWVLDLGATTELYPVLGENAVFIGVGGAGGGKLVKITNY